MASRDRCAGLLVPLVLDRSRLRADATTCHADLGGDAISFIVEPRDPSSLGLGRLGTARFAFATPGSGDLKSCAAGGIALCAYGIAAGGAVFDAESRQAVTIGSTRLKQHLDGMLAAAFGRAHDYAARYPEPSVAGTEPPEAVARFAE